MALTPVTPSRRATRAAPGRDRLWTVIAAVEVVAATLAVLLDLVVPTLVILALLATSLAVRRQGLASLGLRRIPRPGRLAWQVLALTMGWTLLQLAVIIPVLEHLTGQRQDISQFAEVEGNLGLLLVLLALSWTLAAFGEELAYRGYVLTRLRDVLPTGTAGLVTAVVLSSVLFGLAHTEQGLIGVVLTTLDAVFFSVLRYRYGTLWAPILAHGFNNTIGLIAYFLAGPFYGLW
jgi:CAAX protease family protein